MVVINTESEAISDHIIITVRIITGILTVTTTIGDFPTTTIPSITESITTSDTITGKNTIVSSTKNMITAKTTAVIIFTGNTGTDIIRDLITRGTSIAIINTESSMIADFGVDKNTCLLCRVRKQAESGFSRIKGD